MILSVQSTYPREELAEKIAGVLLDKKLIACANIYPVKSLYIWEGHMQNEGEWMVVFKSLPHLREEIEKNIKESHPYELPYLSFELVGTTVEYENWVKLMVVPFH